MKKQEMVYADDTMVLAKDYVQTLFAGKHEGVKYFVLNIGGRHPCGYVEVTGTHFDECSEFNALKRQGRRNFWKSRKRKKREDAYLALGCVHGGITYSNGWLCNEYEPKLMDKHDRWFVGWDYGHYGDKVSYNINGFSRTWQGTSYTTDDVIKDCKKCIKALLDYTKKANNGQLQKR